MTHYTKRKSIQRGSQRIISQSPTTLSIWVIAVASSASLLFVNELASYTSQLSLSPVFGEIPSGLYHYAIKSAIFVAATMASAAAAKLKSNNRLDTMLLVLQFLAISVPMLQPWLWKFATDLALGAVHGPIFVEALTFFPMCWILCYRAGSSLNSIDLMKSTGVRAIVLRASILGMWYAVLHLYGNTIFTILNRLVGKNLFMSRYLTQFVVVALVTFLHPSYGRPKRYMVFLAAVAAGVLWSKSNMRTLAATNIAISPFNHTLLARTESVTGYVSVLENVERGYVMLRCDHSILGGEWLKKPAGSNSNQLREPIYAVFVLLEAVRLVDPPARERTDPEALIIGLGIGTSAAGLIKHGVSTTVVELDPAVYLYAKEYFDLPANHTAHIMNAVDFVREQQDIAGDGGKSSKYDYVLHDVFTGGAVPAALFTVEFLAGLKQLMNKKGVVAINYAGDLKLSAALSILKTIVQVFEKCRAFRDDEPPSAEKQSKVDFTNMVIFCTPFAIKDDGPYFHEPIESDYLNTWVRRNFLYPRFEVDLKKILMSLQDIAVITETNVGVLTNWQKESAVTHWEIMNDVVPEAVWRNY